MEKSDAQEARHDSGNDPSVQSGSDRSAPVSCWPQSHYSAQALANLFGPGQCKKVCSDHKTLKIFVFPLICINARSAWVSVYVCGGVGVPGYTSIYYIYKYLKQPATHMGNKQHQQPNEPCRKHQIINKDYISVEQAACEGRRSVCVLKECGEGAICFRP